MKNRFLFLKTFKSNNKLDHFINLHLFFWGKIDIYYYIIDLNITFSSEKDIALIIKGENISCSNHQKVIKNRGFLFLIEKFSFGNFI